MNGCDITAWAFYSWTAEKPSPRTKTNTTKQQNHIQNCLTTLYQQEDRQRKTKQQKKRLGLFEHPHDRCSPFWTELQICSRPGQVSPRAKTESHFLPNRFVEYCSTIHPFLLKISLSTWMIDNRSQTKLKNNRFHRLTRAMKHTPLKFRLQRPERHAPINPNLHIPPNQMTKEQ